jgi:hypothetical protein
MKANVACLSVLVLLLVAGYAGSAGRPHLADYDAELRRPDGRVDVDAMVPRLKELGVTTYYWLIWHAPTDWDDLKLFLPISMTAGGSQEFRHRHGDSARPERIAAYLRLSLQAWRDGKCDGVVTYCLDKRSQSPTFPLARSLFREFAPDKK